MDVKSKLSVIEQNKNWANLVHMAQGNDKLLLKIFDFIVSKGVLNFRYLDVRERVFFKQKDVSIANLKNARRRAERNTLMEFSIVEFDGIGEVMVTRLPDRKEIE